MKAKIEKLMGGVAFGMTGIGPKPVFSPPNEGGNGDGGNDGGDGGTGGSGDDNGGAGGKSGDESGADGSGKSGDAGSKLAGKGLFGQRKDGGSGDGQGDGNGADDETGTEADGRPKGLADKFWNAKDKTVNVDALMKSHRDAEKALGDLKRQKGPGGGEVPEDASGYFAEGVTVPKEADRFAGLGNDDPGVKSWAATCKKHGVGKDLANALMSDMLVNMNEFAAVPIDPEAEMKSLGKGGPALVDGLFVWCEGLERAGDLSEDDIGVIESMMMTANGARLLAKFRNMSGEKPIPVDPGGSVRGMSMDQLEEAYKKAVREKNYAEQERLDGLRNQINPDGLAPGMSGRQGGYSI